MPKYLVDPSHAVEGLKNLRKHRAEGRTGGIKAAMQSVGSKLGAIYSCPGKSAAAVGIAGSASGMVWTRNTQFLTAQKVDLALARAVKYRAPGRSQGSDPPSREATSIDLQP